MTSEAPNAGFSEAGRWMPVAREHLPVAVSEQEDGPDSVLNFLRALLRWRRKFPQLRVGSERAGSRASAPLIVFDRFDETRVLKKSCSTFRCPSGLAKWPG